MNNENIISWNLPNFVTVVLMIGLVWSAGGIVSHLLMKGGKSAHVGVRSNSAGGIASNG